MITELSAEKVYRACDLDDINCDTSQELTALETIVGQERAIRAMQFGLGIKKKGFNIYVSGLPGTGRTTAVKRFLDELARKKPVPMDWCYVNNFGNPDEPMLIMLPGGRGKLFKEAMENLIDMLR